MKRRISLADDFMHFKTKDLVYGALAHFATYNPNETDKNRKLYLTKKAIAEKKIKKEIANTLGTSPRTLDRHIQELIYDGFIEEFEYTQSNGSVLPAYCFPYIEDEFYQLVDNDILWYVISTRNKNCVKIYAYLLNKYQWKENYVFTLTEIAKALGYSDKDLKHHIPSYIKMSIESMAREGILNIENDFTEKMNDDGSSIQIKRLRLVHVAATLNDLRKLNFTI